MDSLDFLQDLNEQQRQAARHVEGAALILAGAGSGKTRVLTHRMAHLISHHRVSPYELMAVTFTNKAAAEMRHRVAKLLEPLAITVDRNLWVSTFHSSCVRILRSDIQRFGYTSSFTIFDDTDQLSAIKTAMKELNLAESALSPKMIQAKINKVKNEGNDEKSYHSNYGGPIEDAFIRTFERYQSILRKASGVDFADLILLTVKLFQAHADILKKYHERFCFLMVDEYQDTNRAQYLLMKLLAGDRKNICVVGDEDQSIYRWRGADISNILNFEKDFPNAKVFKLVENYRSTKNIIEAASHVISYNIERREKTLFSRNAQGEKIEVLQCYDEHDEAQKAVAEIANALESGASPNEVALFYRTNAQSRVIEDSLRTRGLNYQIFGGMKFYERLEVKDVLAYLRLVENPSDDVSFRRIINVPARGVGAISLERFTKKTNELGVSHYELLSKLFLENDPLVDLGRAEKGFKSFFELIERLRKEKETCLPSALVDTVIDESGYRHSLLQENTIEAQSRLENLAELKQSIVEYELRSGGDNPGAPIMLLGFLEQVALISDLDKAAPRAPAIKLMTIHMAKGLEFDVVLIVGLEEELFPNFRSWEQENTSDIEEERRLFYVGMTRARKKLLLFYAKNRTIFGSEHYRVKSRFLGELPKEYRKEHKADYFSRRRHYSDHSPSPGSHAEYEFSQVYNEGTVTDGSASRENDAYDSRTSAVTSHSMDDEFSIAGAFASGAKVLHPTFGEGVIRQKLDGDKLMVEFKNRGIKKISLRFVELKCV